MQRLWIALGALAGLTAVAMAALAAHGLEWLEPAALGDGAQHVGDAGWHALALLACGLWAPRGGGGWWTGRARRSLLGCCCSAASVYALALGGVHVAMVAPVGGTLLMVGWALLGLSAVVARRD